MWLKLYVQPHVQFKFLYIKASKKETFFGIYNYFFGGIIGFLTIIIESLKIIIFTFYKSLNIIKKSQQYCNFPKFQWHWGKVCNYPKHI